MATISFARGAPSLDIVDVEGLREAAQLAFDSDPAGTTAYGTSVGYVPLREWIAEQHDVAVEQVLVTNGSMQADAFLFELLVQPGDAVIVESPTYDRTLLNLRNRGADVRMVELETDGISIEGARDGALARPCTRSSRTSSPTSRTRPATRSRRRSASGCWSSPSSTTSRSSRTTRTSRSASRASTSTSMLSQDDAGRVVYASSFSKTVCPGIRVGYLVGPQAIIKQIQTLGTNTYISPNMVAQSIVNQFARTGRMDGAIATVKNALRDRRDAVVNALERELPEAKFARPEGGYFMWVELPEAVDVAELEKAAAQRDVLFVKGTDFLLEGGQNTLRLAYSGVTPEQIDEGITKLAEAVESLGVAA